MKRIVFVTGAATFGTAVILATIWGLEAIGFVDPVPTDTKLVIAALIFPAWAYAGWQTAKINRL